MTETPNDRAERLRKHIEFAQGLYRDTAGQVDTCLDRAVLGSLLEFIESDIEMLTWGVDCPRCAADEKRAAGEDAMITPPTDLAARALRRAREEFKKDYEHIAACHIDLALGHLRLAVRESER